MLGRAQAQAISGLCGDRHGGIQIVPVPELEDEQLPQAKAMVPLAAEMLVDDPIDKG